MNETVEKLRKQSIKAIMDVILLAEINNVTMSGYDAISYIHEKFGVLLSSGTIYSHLYALERNGLITSDFNVKTRVFHITEKGEQALDTIRKINKSFLNTLNTILSN